MCVDVAVRGSALEPLHNCLLVCLKDKVKFPPTGIRQNDLHVIDTDFNSDVSEAPTATKLVSTQMLIRCVIFKRRS